MQDYAYFQDRFEIYQYHPVQYGHGVWYNPETETYDEAIERAKNGLYAKVYKDYPHLTAYQTAQSQEPEYKSVVATISDEKPTLSEETQIIEGIETSNKQWLDKLWKNKANYSEKTQDAYNKKYAELNTQQ